jgi:hypothetical protein
LNEPSEDANSENKMIMTDEDEGPSGSNNNSGTQKGLTRTAGINHFDLRQDLDDSPKKDSVSMEQLHDKSVDDPFAGRVPQNSSPELNQISKPNFFTNGFDNGTPNDTLSQLLVDATHAAAPEPVKEMEIVIEMPVEVPSNDPVSPLSANQIQVGGDSLNTTLSKDGGNKEELIRIINE